VEDLAVMQARQHLAEALARPRPEWCTRHLRLNIPLMDLEGPTRDYLEVHAAHALARDLEGAARHRRGQALDERGLARRLLEYGIKSKVSRIGDTTQRG
jgi:hypothetical protein